MKAAWHNREASPEDSSGLQSCTESAYSHYQKRMGGVRLSPMDVDYSAEFKSYPVWVVESDKSILGGLVMVFESDRASIVNIAIDAEFQGQGTGGELIKFAESKAREHNLSELHLATHLLLNENISLYRHLGWEETGGDEVRVFMRKEI